MRDRRVLLGGIVLLALAVRLAGIGDRLSADEGYSWLVANGPFLDRLAAYENTPPLFYLLLEPLPLDDEVWLRLPSLLAGVASVPVLYAAVRPLLGTPAALLAALGLAVAPYHVSFSNYSRGFVLCTLALLVCVWAAARLAQGASRRWWWLYAAGAVAALYSEYYAGLFLAALVVVLVVLGRRDALVFGVLPALAFVPWIPELLEGLDALDETKVSPTYPEPSPAAVRDVLAPLFLGEHGAADAAGARWLQVAAIAFALGASAVSLARNAAAGRAAIWLFGGTALIVLALHAFVAFIGPDLFQQRYLTALIPLAIAVLAGGIAVAPQREAVPVAAAALLALGVAVFIPREGRELEPSVSGVQRVARTSDPVLTNSAVVAFYLRDYEVVVDRPFGLGKGREAELCREGCVIVEDNRVAGGVRPGEGTKLRSDPYSIRIR